MHRWLILLSISALLLGGIRPAKAQASVTFEDVHAEHEFGSQITFQAQVVASGVIREVLLTFQAEGQAEFQVQSLQPDAEGIVIHQYDIEPGILRPFARITFWFQVTLEGNEQFTSPRYTHEYTDNRVPWRTREGENIRLHWETGGATFGETAFQAATGGLEKLNALLPVTLAEPLDIYIYSSASDIEELLDTGGTTRFEGHASPELGVVLVSIPPGPEQQAELERQIPYEIAHVILYQLSGDGYYRLPAWLREGIAAGVEGIPDPERANALTTARQSDTLIPMAELCLFFPTDATQAALAAAESESFTRYLHKTIGTAGLQALLQAYTNGLNCEDGTSQTLGLPLATLDSMWRDSELGKVKSKLSLGKLLPYLVILVILLLIPIWQLFLARRKAVE